MADYVPVYSGVFNDSFYYWRQVGTFSAAGFNGGYYTSEELPARAPYSHFYAHGPVFPLLYGSVASFTGWYSHTGILFNLMGITTAFGLWLYRIRHAQGKMILSGLALVTTWGGLFFIPTNMQESVHFSLAILLALCVVPSIAPQKDVKGRKLWRVATLVVLTLAMLLRPTWAVLVPPLFWIWSQQSSIRVRFFFLLGLFVLLGGIVFSFSYHSAPYSLASYLPSEINFARISSGLLARVKYNLLTLFTLNPIELVQIIQVVSLGFLLFIITFQRSRLKISQLRKYHLDWMLSELVLHIFNLVGCVSFIFLFYEIGNFKGFRQFTPHLLLSLLLLIAQRRFRIVSLLIVIGIVALPSFLTNYQSLWYASFHRENADIETFRQQSTNILIYDPDALNAWCNTLLVVLNETEIPPQMMKIHPALGVSWTKLTPNQSFRSRYVLLTEADQVRLGDLSALRPALQTEAGTIFLNTQGDCPYEP